MAIRLSVMTIRGSRGVTDHPEAGSQVVGRVVADRRDVLVPVTVPRGHHGAEHL